MVSVSPMRRRAGVKFAGGSFARSERNVAQETAVAISVGGSTHAVLMATPQDLEDMAIGLVLNERIATTLADIDTVDIVETPLGVDCQVRLVPERAATYTARRRQMTGPVGCGLCGVESLELAGPELPPVKDQLRLGSSTIEAAMAAMSRRQKLGAETRAVHAAAFHHCERGLLVTREDVGRHNALDKVAGHLARDGVDPRAGFLTLTSRVSVELIQKAAVMGCGLIAAVSAPTDLAIREADAAGITLVAVVRGDEFEVFTHFDRIAGAAEAYRDEAGTPSVFRENIDAA